MVGLVPDPIRTPEDVAAAFRESGLERFVYRGAVTAPFPTLREMIASRKPLRVADTQDYPGWIRFTPQNWLRSYVSVPIIVSLKGVTKPGLVDRAHVVSSGLDLIPTLCDFAGIAVPPELPGHSVRALAEGRDPGPWRPYVVSETHYGRMVCSGRYKYCVYESGQRRESLVDLTEDLGEMKNLAASPAHAQVLDEHRAYFRQWLDRYGDSFAAKYAVR